MVTVCQQCGDKGFTNAFVCCVKCLDAVVHRYCLDVMPETYDEFVRWICDGCEVTLSQKREFKIRENVDDFYVVGAKKNGNTQTDEDICTNLDKGELSESGGGSGAVKNLAIISCNGSSKSSEKEKTIDSSEAKGLRSEYKTEMFNEEREIEKREESISATTNNFPKNSSISSAEPVRIPIWRGSFNICNKKEDILGLVAHMSSKACRKVYDTASKFQPVLDLEMLPKPEIWPKSFQTAEPSGDNIALYFFPSKMSEGTFDDLVDEMMNKELGMKACLHNAELLIFTSTELPLLYWRFKGKYYLWGVFRGKQSAPSQSQSSTIESEGKVVTNTDLPKVNGLEKGKVPVPKTKCGYRSSLRSRSNPRRNTNRAP